MYNVYIDLSLASNSSRGCGTASTDKALDTALEGVNVQIVWLLARSQFVEELWITFLLRCDPFLVVLKDLVLGLSEPFGDRLFV